MNMCIPDARCRDRRAVLANLAASRIIGSDPHLTLIHLETVEVTVLFLQYAAGAPFPFIQEQLNNPCGGCGAGEPSLEVLKGDLNRMLHLVVEKSRHRTADSGKRAHNRAVTSSVKSLVLTMTPKKGMLHADLRWPGGETEPAGLTPAQVKMLMSSEASDRKVRRTREEIARKGMQKVFAGLRDHLAHHRVDHAWEIAVPAGSVADWQRWIEQCET